MNKYIKTANYIDIKTANFIYQNHKGERRQRAVIPVRIWWGDTEWFLRAHDLDKGEERDFALADILHWLGPDEGLVCGSKKGTRVSRIGVPEDE